MLVNPGVPLETKSVFARIGLRPGESLDFGKHPDIADAPERDALFAALKRARNDMEDAASVLAPIIGHCLAVLSAARGVKLARMSGSGRDMLRAVRKLPRGGDNRESHPPRSPRMVGEGDRAAVDVARRRATAPCFSPSGRSVPREA